MMILKSAGRVGGKKDKMAGAITTVIPTRPLSMPGVFMEKDGSVTVHVAVKHPALGRPHTFSSKFITALVFQCRPTVSASEQRIRLKQGKKFRDDTWIWGRK